jgi:hypothetical protein
MSVKLTMSGAVPDTGAAVKAAWGGVLGAHPASRQATTGNSNTEKQKKRLDVHMAQHLCDSTGHGQLTTPKLYTKPRLLSINTRGGAFASQ